MINSARPLFCWGPIDGKPFFTHIWWYGIKGFNQQFYGWPDVLEAVHQEKLYFFCDLKELQEQGKNNFVAVILNDTLRKQAFKRWKAIVKTLDSFFGVISEDKLKSYSDIILAKKYEQFVEIKAEFWTIGLLPEVANLGSDLYLQKKLEKIVSSCDAAKIMETVCASEKLTFYQQAELDLLKIKRFQTNKQQQLCNKKLQEHQRKYHWLLNSYYGSKELSVDYFREELDTISLKEAEEKIREIKRYTQQVKEKQKKIINYYRLTKELVAIAKLIGFCAWWHYERKKHILQAIYYFTLFLREIERRKKVAYDDLCYYTIEDIRQLLEKEVRINEKEINLRKQCFLLYYHAKENKEELFAGKKALTMLNPFINLRFDKSLKECKGIVASKGNNNNNNNDNNDNDRKNKSDKRIKGSVRVLHSAEELKTMKPGEILVSPMTSPDFIIAMKKAKAIITDYGSLTSHAAVVSRELGIPCVVNAKIATKIFKTGDTIEIDVLKGVVKKIEHT